MTPDDRTRRRAFWRRVRRRMGLVGIRSQNELGRRVGVQSGAVSQWFAKLTMPAGETLLHFPRVLKCSGHWLLTGELPEEAPNGKASAEYRAGMRATLADLEDAVETIRARRVG